ncbi:MATE family efflux transporter [Alkalimarinus alittae]|uniref:MATE family efflux transporter n=1 Tax=Alkalimarinus alittae TaxID=2961619 RepID=A0ABY6N5X9_9ALTE|nr:MATE family efflux transporter [Alkalimarinus alittae]UZE97397.1 MATE family efflux transporter [Alkalimarinus alittae]
MTNQHPTPPPARKPSARLTQGPVDKTLITLSRHMALGIISIIFINVVDTFYVGQLGAKELAAISFTFPVTMIVISLAMGLSIGTSALVSRAIGSGDHGRVKRLTTDCLALAFILVFLVALTGYHTIDPIFTALGASMPQIDLIHDYMSVWYVGVGLVVIPMVGNSAIRATGDTKTPSRVMLVAAAVNIILDPLLIFGLGPFPRLELTGAALATLISYSLTFLFSLWVLILREKMLTIAIPSLADVWRSWSSLLKLALPAATTNMMAPVTIGILTHLAASYGDYAVAALGVGTRIESLAMIGVMALSSVLTPFIGQNWGAKKYDRVQQSLNFAIKFALLWGASLCIVLALSAPVLSRLFSDNPDVIHLIEMFLRMVPISYAGMGLIIVTSATYNAFHQPKQAAILVLTRLFILMVPLAFIGAQIWGVIGIFAGVMIANILAGILAFTQLKRKIRTLMP